MGRTLLFFREETIWIIKLQWLNHSAAPLALKSSELILQVLRQGTRTKDFAAFRDHQDEQSPHNLQTGKDHGHSMP